VTLKNNEDLPGLLERQKEFFLSGKTRSLIFRKDMLHRLRAAIEKRTDAIVEALFQDMRKPPVEAFTAEIAVVLAEIRHTLSHLDRWATPRRRKSPYFIWPGKTSVHPEPYGVTLIVGPWNYPFGLLVHPLVSAIAAGNCAVLKPSEFTPNTNQCIEKLIGETFESRYISLCQGGGDVVQSLIRKPLDHIFFTGSTATGKKILSAAADHCIPTVMELGGKNPCIMDESAHVETAVRRIAHAKFFNAGQTCVAPDYLCVPENKKTEIIAAFNTVIAAFYTKDPAQSPDFARIINEHHFNRIHEMAQGCHILAGGRFDRDTSYVAPTLVDAPSWDHPLLQEEIFGPLLPVITFTDFDHLITRLQSRAAPLAVYFFSQNKVRQKVIGHKLQSGSLSINDAFHQVTSPGIPFGGQGESGMGQYHGKEGFEAFCRRRTIIQRNPRFEFLTADYPPYKNNFQIVRKYWKWFFR